MNLPDPRHLAGIRFGLSISAAPDMPAAGDAERAVAGLTFRLASTILLEGGTLLLGHRWIPDGIMEHLAFQARDNRWNAVRRSAEASGEAPILNLIAWPDSPLSEDRNAQRMIAEGVLSVRQVPPPGIAMDQFDVDPAKALASDLGQFARIRALTALRQEMVRCTDARVCVGGAAGNPLRRLPGVIEEALLTAKAGKPLYLSGALGGAAKAMADALLRRRLSDEARAMFFTPPAIAGLLSAHSAAFPVPPEEGPSSEDGWNALDDLQAIPLAQLGAKSGLTEEEYVQLLTSTDVQRVLGLAIAGINRLRGSGSSPV
ncbi:MAG: hypothetical protein WBP72_07290 [Rhodocyclaceae bacterium]